MENAERMCDAVCIISNGVKVLDGAVADVKAEYGNQRVAVVLDGRAGAGQPAVLEDAAVVRSMSSHGRLREIELVPGVDPQALLHRLVGEGATVERFELVRPSLHEIFLDKVGAGGIERGMSGHG